MWRVVIKVNKAYIGYALTQLKKDEVLDVEGDCGYYTCDGLSKCKNANEVRAISLIRINSLNRAICLLHDDCHIDVIHFNSVQLLDTDKNTISDTVFAQASATSFSSGTATGVVIRNETSESSQNTEVDYRSYYEKFPVVREVLNLLLIYPVNYLHLRQAVEVMFQDDNEFKKMHYAYPYNYCKETYAVWTIFLSQREQSNEKAIHQGIGKFIPGRKMSEAEIISYPKQLFKQWCLRKSSH